MAFTSPSEQALVLHDGSSAERRELKAENIEALGLHPVQFTAVPALDRCQRCHQGARQSTPLSPHGSHAQAMRPPQLQAMRRAHLFDGAVPS